MEDNQKKDVGAYGRTIGLPLLWRRRLADDVRRSNVCRRA